MTQECTMWLLHGTSGCAKMFTSHTGQKGQTLPPPCHLSRADGRILAKDIFARHNYHPSGLGWPMLGRVVSSPAKCSITCAFFFPLDHCRRLLSSQCNAARVTHNDGAGISIARHFYLATLERGQPSIGDWLALGWVLFSSNPCYIYYLHSTTPLQRLCNRL